MTADVAAAAASVRHRHVAVVFFGKHPADFRRAKDMGPSLNASQPLLERCAASWTRRLFGANKAFEFDVFAHSWSPEVSSLFDQLYSSPAPNARLISSLHQPTLFRDGSSKQLDIQCAGPSCERTASMLMSVDRGLQLKRDHELRKGIQYDFVLAARHDLIFGSDVELRREHWAAGPRDVWLLRSCLGMCTASDPAAAAVPPNCMLRSDLCPIPFITDKALKFRSNRVHSDWLFAGSSASADAMGDAVRTFREAAVKGRAQISIFAHLFWPFHAKSVGLSLRFGIAMYPRDVLLARDALREASDAAFGTFLPSGEVSIGSTEDLDKLSHDELYNRQCVTGSGAREEGINSRVLLMCCRNGTRPTDFHGCQRQ